MSQTIDQKVVEMQFNNAQFESNVKTSLSTLDKLKSALNFGGMTKGLDSLDQASKNIDFSQMANSLSAIEKRFSTMGIIGKTVIEELTKSTIGFVKNGIGSVVGAMASGGTRRAFNIENAHFQLQGLLKDEEKVKAVMDDAMQSVDGTAYAYDEAAKAASQFAASGMQAGEEMQSALKAITGVAAMTNSDYESISRIFTTVAGNGRLMGDELLQLSSRGMNAAATITEYFNGVNNGSIKARESVTAAIKEISSGTQVTEADIRDLVSKGKISFEIFSSAMDNAFGEHAKKANETVTGAFSNVKAALSRIGADFISPLIEQNGPIVQFLNTLRERINEIRTIVSPFADFFTTTINDTVTKINGLLGHSLLDGPFGNFLKSKNSDVLNAKDLFNLNFDEKTYAAFQKVLIDTAKEHGVAIDEMIENEGSFNATIKNGWLTSDIFKEAVSKITDGSLTKGAEKTAEDLELIKKTATEVIQGNWGDSWTDRIEKLTEAGFSEQQIQSIRDYVNILSELTGGSWNLTDAIFSEADARLQNKETIEEASDEQLKNMGYTEEEIKLLRDWAKTADETGGAANEELSSLLDRLNKPQGIFGLFQGVVSVFSKIKEYLVTVKDSFVSAFSSDTFSNVKDTLLGIWSAIKLVGSTLAAIFGPFFISAAQVLGSVLDGVLKVAAAVGRLITKIYETLKASDTFNALRESFTKIFSGLATAISKIINVVAPFLTNVIDKITSKVPAIHAALSNLLNLFRQKIAAPGFAIVSALLDRIKTRFAGVSETAVKAKDAISETFGKIGTALKNSGILNVITAVWNALKSIGTAIASIIGNSLMSIIDKIASGDFKGGFDILNSFISAGIGVGIINFIKSLKSSVEGFGGIGTGIKDLLGGLSDTLSAYQEKLKADVLMKIAIAIGILAGSLLVLSLIDSEKLSMALGAITVLFAELVGAMALLTKIADGKKIRGVSTAMVAMAAAVLILSIALKKISSIDGKDMIKALVGVGVLLAMVVVAAKALSSKGKAAIKGGLQMILFAEAVKLLADAVLKLSNLSWKQLAKGLAGVGALLAEIAIFTRIASFDKRAISNALGMLILTFAIKRLVDVVKVFAEMNKEQIIKGIASLGAVLLELALFMRLSGDPKHMLSTGIGMIAMAGALKILAGVVKDFGDMPIEQLGKGLLAMAFALAAIALAVNLIPARIALIGPAMILIGGALIMMAHVIKEFGGMEWEQLGKGLATLGGSLIIIAIACNLMKGALGGAAAMIVMSVAIGMLTPSLKALGKMKMKEIGKALLVLAGTFVIFGVAGSVLGGVIPILLLLSVAIAAFGVGILAIGAGTLIAGIGLQALAAGIKDLGSAMASSAKDIALGLKDIIVEIVKALPEVIKSLGPVIGSICDVIIENAPKIGKAFRAMVIEALKTIDQLVPRIVDTALNVLVKVLNGLVTHGAEIGEALSKLISGALDFIKVNGGEFGNKILDIIIGGFRLVSERAGEIIEIVGDLGNKLGQAIGKFIGGIVSGFIDTTSESLAGAGTALSAFVDNGKSFFDALPKFKENGALEAVDNLISIVMKMTAATLLDAITEFLLGKSAAKSFTDTMTQLGKGMTAFADNLGDSLNDTNKLTATKNLTDLVLQLVNGLPETGGIVQKITGWKDLGNFGSDLVSLANGVGAYADVLDQHTFDPEQITASMLIGELASSIQNNLPESGGLVQKIAGYKNLGNFGSDLVSLANGVGAYADVLDEHTFDTTQIQASMMIGELASSIQNNLPESGGLVQKIAGYKDLGGFGEDLVPFANGVGAYADVLSQHTFDPMQITASMLIGQIATTIANDLPDSGGVLQKITGYKDLGSFGEDLTPFAQGISDFANSVDGMGLDEESFEKAKQIANFAVELSNKLPESGGLIDFITGAQDLGDFSTDMESLGTGIANFANAINGSEYDENKVNNAIAIAESLSTIQKTLADTSLEDVNPNGTLSLFGDKIAGFGNSMNTFYGYIAEWDISNFTKAGGCFAVLKIGIEDFLTISFDKLDEVKSKIDALKELEPSDLLGDLTTKSDAIFNAAVTLSDALAAGLNDTSGDGTDLKESGGVLVGKVIEGIKNKADDMHKAGQSSTKNYINGLKQLSKLKAAGSTVASTPLTQIMAKGILYLGAGIALASKLLSGLTSLNSTIETCLNSAITTCSNNVWNKYQSFYSAGAHVVAGLNQGMKDALTDLIETVNQIVSEVNKAIREKEKIKSPSKVWTRFGEYMGGGLALGIYNSLRIIRDSAVAVADEANRSLSSALSGVSDVLMNGMDAEPTIRPVVDLSDVEAGSMAISQLLNMSGSIGLNSNIGSLAYAMAGYSNGATNDDVISAINGLRKNLGVRGDTYNINGITYDDGSNITDAVRTLVRAARVERRG